MYVSLDGFVLIEKEISIMNVAKKVLNVFGILLAWILSIALVVMLIVTPTVMSALSLLEPDTITELVTSVFDQPDQSAAAPQKTYGISNLSSTTGTTDTTGNTSDQMPDLDDILGGLDLEAVGDLFGVELDEQIVNKVLNSNAAKEFIQTYTEDITNAITGSSGEPQFNAEKIVEIVEENIDEIVDIIQEVDPSISKDEVEKIKQDIKTAVVENAESFVEALPKPEQIVTEIVKSSPELEMALEIVAQKENIKKAIVGAIVVLSVLIFLFRLPGFRGLRWLATDLFVAAGFGGVICFALSTSASLITELVGDEAALVDMVSWLISSFVTGVMIRTAIILVAAIVLLVAYILIKKALAKKAAVQEQPALPAEE